MLQSQMSNPERPLQVLGVLMSHILHLCVDNITEHDSDVVLDKNVSGYVCNHGSPSGEQDTASPRGRYGERPQRDSV